MDSVPQKQCTTCKQFFPATLEYFSKCKKAKDGLNWKCKPCDRARSRKHYNENKEAIIKRTGDYAKAHPDQRRAISRRHYYNNRESELARARGVYAKRRLKIRVWYFATIEERKAYDQHYRETHKDEISRRGKDYYRRHPEKAMESYTKRRARELEAEGHYTKSDVELLIRSQKGLCWWCGKPVGDSYHVDHRIALTKGGTNWPDNLCISCPECNRSKGNKLPHEWNGRLL